MVLFEKIFTFEHFIQWNLDRRHEKSIKKLPLKFKRKKWEKFILIFWKSQLNIYS